MPATRSQRAQNPKSVPPKASAKKTSTKRVRSPEPPAITDTDTAQPQNKRRKQPKSAAATKSNPVAVQPKTTKSSSITKTDPKLPPPPNYTGNFDIYSMELSFLSKVYLPKGASTPQYEELYKTILTYQAKDDNTAQCYLAPPADTNTNSIFQSQDAMDPMQELPFEIAIRSIKHEPLLSLPSNKLTSAVSISVADSPGISASTALEEIHCGIQSASGMFKLKRVWIKAVDDGNFVELFEGYFSFNVSYSGLYRRKGHSPGEKHKWAFWAVRARKGDDGKEMGLWPVLPISVNAKVGAPAMHPAATAPAVDTMKVKQADISESSSSPPRFAGNFDLYSTSDLIEEGHVQGKPLPSYDQVYEAIINSQPEITAQCYLGPPVSQLDDELDLDSDDVDLEESDSVGRFRGPTICDPFGEQPYNIILTSIEPQDTLAFTDEELDQFPERDLDPSGPGMTALVSLARGGHPRVDSGSGYIKFVRVWTEAGPAGQLLEVFEAYIKFDVVFEWSFRLKGRGREETHAIAFWAVRAKKDEKGQEIGLSSQPEESSDCC